MLVLSKKTFWLILRKNSSITSFTDEGEKKEVSRELLDESETNTTSNKLFDNFLPSRKDMNDILMVGYN